MKISPALEPALSVSEVRAGWTGSGKEELVEG